MLPQPATHPHRTHPRRTLIASPQLSCHRVFERVSKNPGVSAPPRLLKQSATPVTPCCWEAGYQPLLSPLVVHQTPDKATQTRTLSVLLLALTAQLSQLRHTACSTPFTVHTTILCSFGAVSTAPAVCLALITSSAALKMSAFRHPPLSHSRATRQLQPVTRHVLVGFHAPQRLPQRGSSTTCQFWGGLTQLFGGEERQQDQALSLYSLVEEELDSSHPAQPHNHDRMYSSLLQQAEEITFNSAAPQTDPAGTSAGGALLEDAERMLELCIQQRPQHLQPRVLLLRNLMRQGGARERDVPSLAIQALQEAGRKVGCNVASRVGR